MSFLDHLEELRWHIIRSFIAIFAFAIIIFAFQETVFDLVLFAHLKPDFPTYTFFCDVFSKFGSESSFCNISFNQTLQALNPSQQLMTAIWASMILGFVFAFPYVLFEIWRFIAPGLKDNERKKSKGFIFWSSLLFFIGILFSYFVIIPMSVYFFYNYQISTTIVNNFKLDAYISLVTNTLIGIGLFFELPILIIFLTKIGIIEPKHLKEYRKHAFVVVLIVSAIITPPDVASQLIVSAPIMLLYEISIYMSIIINKRNQNQLKTTK